MNICESCKKEVKEKLEPKAVYIGYNMRERNLCKQCVKDRAIRFKTRS